MPDNLFDVLSGGLPTWHVPASVSRDSTAANRVRSKLNVKSTVLVKSTESTESTLLFCPFFAHKRDVRYHDMLY
jgi:hypothetical protein